jgi:hypothetical protein
MAFVQIRSYTTTRREELDATESEWIEDTQGVRTARRRILLADRDLPNRFVELTFFDSYEAAMHNSMLPATSTIHDATLALVDGGFEYQNLNVLRDDVL